MSKDRDKNLGIVRGGLYAKRDPRPWAVVECAREMQERIVAMMLGKKKRRVLRSVQAGSTNPSGEPMKLAASLREARLSYNEARRIVIVPQDRALARLYGKQFDTGEYPTPPAASAHKERKSA